IPYERGLLGHSDADVLLHAITDALFGAAASSYADAFAAWERQFLIDALAASNGKVTEAAARIGIGRATFYKKLATLGIDT
ncbi:2-C-methyl-D-erythritol 2,4-cyclodiphosphate synthase, partial [Burkholderia pseudomallei]|uniref:2-C-methyl-D-erythritol 2,4-cyclodiphosphate synthase n=1 Tax=Burkholderia pseudomallei TaxID=28450 RepID=UPI0021F7E6ED